MMSNKVFISIDANDTGKRLERYILNEDLMGLCQFSSNITAAINDIKEKIYNNNGFVYMVGGDNILADIPIENTESIFQSIKEICCGKESIFAIGVGDSAIGSYLALKYAKAMGKFIIRCRNNDFSEINIELGN